MSQLCQVVPADTFWMHRTDRVLRQLGDTDEATTVRVGLRYLVEMVLDGRRSDYKKPVGLNVPLYSECAESCNSYITSKLDYLVWLGFPTTRIMAVHKGLLDIIQRLLRLTF